jgi:hypothetical protein
MIMRRIPAEAWRFLLSVLLSVLIASCASIHHDGDRPVVNNEIHAIQTLLAEKQDAARCGDMDRFLAVLDPADTTYVVEQEHWLQYFRSADVHDFTLEMEDIAKRDDNTYVAAVVQRYAYGPEQEKRQCRFNQTYVLTTGGWKDADLEFQETETDHFVLRAVDGVSDRQKDKIAADAEEAYTMVKRAYGSAPRDKTVIKIYKDPALVRDLTKVSAERLMYGWYEYPESIKMVARRKPRYSYARLIAHELMHKTSLSQAANQCPWFAEGLAVYFGTFQALGGTYSDKGWINSSEYLHTIDWLERQNPENLDGWNTIIRYYGTSGMVVHYIEDEYGQGRAREIVARLGRFPHDSEGFEYEKHNALYSAQLFQAIEEVLNVDREAFNDRWMNWIKGQIGKAE